MSDNRPHQRGDAVTGVAADHCGLVPGPPDAPDLPGTGPHGRTVGPAIAVANEFTEVVVQRLETRNGTRLLIEVPRAGRSIALCPLELEALTWQTPAVFSAMMANPSRPLDLDEQ